MLLPSNVYGEEGLQKLISVLSAALTKLSSEMRNEAEWNEAQVYAPAKP